MLQRWLALPEHPDGSFFLWGPRTPARPHSLREELLARRDAGPVVIDEVQRVPALLDEVHWLIENRGTRFALCGSSARKVRRGHANLLGGRAIRYELLGLVSAEIAADFDLVRALNHGLLPRHYLADDALPLLRSYVGDYLKEEIAAEGLVRNPGQRGWSPGPAIAYGGVGGCGLASTRPPDRVMGRWRCAEGVAGRRGGAEGACELCRRPRLRPAALAGRVLPRLRRRCARARGVRSTISTGVWAA